MSGHSEIHEESGDMLLVEAPLPPTALIPHLSDEAPRYPTDITVLLTATLPPGA